MGKWIKEEFGNIVSRIQDGGTPSRNFSDNFGGNINWIVISDIKRFIKTTKENLTDKGFAGSSTKLFPSGSIVLSFGATIGEVGISKISFTTKQGIAGIEVDKKKIDTNYVYYYLLTQYDRLNNLAVGSTIREIRPDVIKSKLIINYPESLDEQRRIADILTTVDDAIDSVQAVIDKHELIKQGMMHDLFTRGVDPATGSLRPHPSLAPQLYQDSELGLIPKEWEVKRLGDGCSLIKDGTHFSPITKQDGAFMYITSKNIKNGVIDFSNLDFIDIKQHKTIYLGSPVRFGDLLMTKDGANTGNLAVNTIIDEFSLLSSVAFIRGKNDYLDNLYLYFLFSSQEYQSRFRDQMSGNAIPRITLLKIGNAKYVHPLFNEQIDIVSRIKVLYKRIEGLVGKKQKLLLQKQGLMQDLLSGKVRVI